MTKKLFNLILSLMMSMVLVGGCVAQKGRDDKRPEKPPERIKEKEKEKPKPPPPDKKRPD
jgi:hypothetical protein